MSELIRSLEADQARLRREALTRRVLDTLRGTLQLTALKPDASVDEVRADFTDQSAIVVAPLIEAVEVLEAIIWASDGCVGHRQCSHSMEPWQRARALLSGKWDAEAERRNWPSTARDNERTE